MPQNRDIEARLAGLKGIIWDLDNTLYRADEAIELAFNMAMARAAIEAGAPLEFGEAVKMSRKSYDECGYSGRVFIERYGISRDHLHYISHGFIDEKAIKAPLEAQQLFANLAVKNALITHSSAIWADKVLSHLGFTDFFPAERVFAFEHYNFERKSETTRAFDMALARLGLSPKEVLVVEDVAVNLRIPHEMGMATILLHHGRRPRDIPHYAHWDCSNMLDVLRKITGLKREIPHTASL